MDNEHKAESKIKDKKIENLTKENEKLKLEIKVMKNNNNKRFTQRKNTNEIIISRSRKRMLC